MYFEKSYSGDEFTSRLPAPQYWLDREETILSYLAMRGCAVPDVIFKDNKRKKVRLKDVGCSLENYIKQGGACTEADVCWALKSAIVELKSIFELGVQHLDISTRNITVDRVNSKVYILDFGHAIYLNLKLLKPIPLRPTKALHHIDLYNCLLNDWQRFFQNTGGEWKDIKDTFTINDQAFSDYWDDNFEVQNLAEHEGVLAHGISNLIDEISGASCLSIQFKIELHKISESLKNLNKNDGCLKLISAIKKLNTICSIQTPNSTVPKNGTATPIPLVVTQSDRDSTHSVGNTRRSFYHNMLNWLRNKSSAIALVLISIANIFILDNQAAVNKYRFDSKEIGLILDVLMFSISVFICSFLLGNKAGLYARKLVVIIGLVVLSWVETLLSGSSSIITILLFFIEILLAMRYLFIRNTGDLVY